MKIMVISPVLYNTEKKEKKKKTKTTCIKIKSNYKKKEKI